MPGPLVITGTGGSGTRVVARIAMKAGWHLGHDRNDQEDNMRIARVENHPLGTRFLEDGGPSKGQLAHYRNVMERERCGRSRWGWKHPQSMHFMPWIYEAYPDTLRVLHVIRDGRDMAYSRNVFEHWYGRFYAGETERELAPQPVRNAKLWARSNLRLTDFAEGRFPERYMQMRLESLCEDPMAATDHIFAFFEGEKPPCTRIFDSTETFMEHEGKVRDASSLVETPDTLGRWRDKPCDERRSVQQAAMPGLERYGYA